MSKSAKPFKKAAFLRQHRTAYLEELREAGRPITLRINDSEELVVADDQSYQRLCELVDRLETIEAVRQGLEDKVRLGRLCLVGRARGRARIRSDRRWPDHIKTRRGSRT